MKRKTVSILIVMLLIVAPIFTLATGFSGPPAPDRTSSQPTPTPTPGSQRVPVAASPSGVSPLGIVSPATAQNLAAAMGIQASDIVSASLNGSDANGVGIGNTPLGSFFPSQGTTFAILSTGLATSADDANTSGGLSALLGGLNNSQGQDLTQLALQLHVPAGMNCATVDFAYYSEEFPEFVGSQFNDAFTAEVGGTNLSIVNNQVVAPLNFAFDSQGHVISVNTVIGVAANTGTTYDGGTSLVRARTPVTANSNVTFVFSVQDLGDSIYDSAVFLDRFVWSNQSTCTSGTNPTFADVPLNYWAWSWIERLYADGITGGCATNPLRYCPEASVSRAEMAVFLERGIHGSSYTPPVVPLTFTDTTSNFARYWIEALKNGGITSGCGPSLYCPNASTTRAEMAIFLLRSKHGASYVPPAATGTMFTDVPTSYWAARWIEQLANEGITSGCGTNLYCPDATVTRAQMAIFLVRTFNLP